MQLLSAVCLAAVVAFVAADNLIVDKKGLGATFDGIGGLSGGGATSRLLPDYVEPQRTEILDFLFTPNFGASLQILKVEIGGDSQSTDGTESSHMHSADDLDYKRGYEWWLLAEAKKRNPNIKTYGLPWAFPGWVGNGTGSPFTYPDLTTDYTVKWVQGAKSEYGVDIDYLGIWNERSSDATYVKLLRKKLSDAGFHNTKIVAKDGGADICNDMAKDKDYAAAVDIIGLHYPSDYNDYSLCHSLGKPVWASEESSSYDDLNGAACWARVTTSHWVLSQMTASIMWNLVGSYAHGTNWYASSMFTADQPWSGWYDVGPVVWATAHVTQFTEVGWKYLKNKSGSGELPNGGFYATLVDDEGSDFTILVVKIDEQHAPCTRPHLPPFSVSAETVTFQLEESMGNVDSLAFWLSNFEAYGPNSTIFERQDDVKVVDGKFTVHVPVGAFMTFSTIKNGPQKGTHPTPPASNPTFPLPYSDDFQKVEESQEAHYFADQIGAFEAHPETNNPSNMVMKQMVPELPIGWGDHGSQGPMTVIGMLEWQDINVSVSFKLPTAGPANVAGCVSSRSDQMGTQGLFFCVYATGNWTLSNGGPRQDTGFPRDIVAKGSAGTVPLGKWHSISLSVSGTSATGILNGKALFQNTAIRDMDTGFSTIGSNVWAAVEYDQFSLGKVGNRWNPKSTCGAAKAGDELSVTNCSTNGVPIADQVWVLLPSYNLMHKPSGLCAQNNNGKVVLATCDPANQNQQFVNDYTRIRNAVDSMTVGNNKLVGSSNGKVQVGGNGDWNSWCFFPNTGQLRNQYTTNTKLGFPRCLSTCAPSN